MVRRIDDDISRISLALGGEDELIYMIIIIMIIMISIIKVV